MTLLLLACAGEPGTGETAEDSAAPHDITEYAVTWSAEPALVAGQESEFTLQVTDQDGHPIEDLQQNHDRMVHTIFVSSDWSSFTHVHHEDFYEVGVEDIRNGRFHFPLTLPTAGRYYALFDFANKDLWLQETDYVDVTGASAHAEAPSEEPYSEVAVDGLRVSLSWDIEPVATYEAAWTARITEADGTEVTDLVQYLAADAHCALVNATTDWGSHTHAWFPDMGNMAPGMEMPHLYDGPDVPFHYVFPSPGRYKMWVQFTRESAPGVVYTAPFVFDVGG